MAKIVSELSSLFMLSSDALGSELLSKKFQQLLYNDLVINESFFSSIKIWECYWYYDSSKRGYGIGDAVWYNTEDKVSFVQKYHTAIKEYTDYNSRILYKLPNWNSTSEEVIDAYLNAMSGYTDKTLGKNVVLPPIFDIGDIEKPIQIFVSTKNNNRDLLSNKDSWMRVFVDSDEDEENLQRILKTYFDKKSKDHLDRYHFGGKRSAENAKVRSQLSNYIDTPALSSNLTYTNLPNSWYIGSGESPEHGVDYVTAYIRKPYVLSGEISEYQATRYWKSGRLEHFGTVSKYNPMFWATAADGISCLKIPFDWRFIGDSSGAKAYKRGEMGIPSQNNVIRVNETEENVIPPLDDFINVTYELAGVTVDSSPIALHFKDANYYVNVSPVYQTPAGLAEDYLPVSYDVYSYKQNWNNNFLTDELLEKKDSRALWFRLDSRILPPYISYYAVGARS